MLAAGCGWSDADSAGERKEAFEEVIGFAPTDAVRDIESSYYWVRDSYSRWLVFQCDQTTIARLRALNTASKSALSWGNSSGPGRHEGQNPNAPDWWKDGPAVDSLEPVDIDHSTKDKTDVTHLWIDVKGLTIYAKRDVLD